jgi:exopolyphosphatase/guanosine-5'-triphosphate,3'-diphosphate pyrophosphatase
VRLAVIDLGTNTVRLLVADVTRDAPWTTVHAEQQVTRVGEGLRTTGTLGAAPMARTAVTVATYVARAREAGARAVRVVATSALREARNGAAFAARIAADTGERVEIISGDEEARLTLRGLRRGLLLDKGTLMAFDIGGGSTEYVRARDGVLIAAVSLTLGVVPLAERFAFPSGLDATRYATLRDEIRGRLASELPLALVDGPVDVLVGTAGTVTTLAALDLGLTTYDPARVHGHRLTRGTAERLLARLGALTLADRGALPCLEPGRADLIIPGTAIVLATMERFGVEAVIVSEYGLREGIMDAASESAS